MATHSLMFSTVLATVLTVLLSTQGAQAQAPDDTNQRCTTGSFAKTYDEGVQVLMDSDSYEQLLGTQSAAWYTTDFDDNNDPGSFIYQTNWRHSLGGLCRWSVQSCGYGLGTQDNWAITQHITKSFPSDFKGDTRICVNVTHGITSCRERHGCTPVFEMMKYVTNTARDTNELRNQNNWESAYLYRAEQLGTVFDHFCFPFNSEENGFYLALRDRTSCILVSSLLAYRYQCAAKQEGLVKFPETPSAAEGSRVIDSKCVENAEPVSSSLAVECRDDGYWTAQTPQCRCKPGFREITENGVKSCVACPKGTYRSSSDVGTTCIQCPLNTMRDEEGVAECKCLTGYYRNIAGLSDQCPTEQTFEGPAKDCTQPPTKPVELQLSSTPTKDTISIQWKAPLSDGGRTDHYYTVEHSDPDNVGQFINPTADMCLTVTEFEIDGLLPATDYLIRVSVHNGVSDQDRDGTFSRIAEITERTDIVPPSAPLDVVGMCNIVIWRTPAAPNGEITAYEVKFYRQNSPSNAVTKSLEDDTKYYVIENDVEPAGTGILFVEVRAENEAGKGDYSAAVPVVCEEDRQTPVTTIDLTTVECPPQVVPEIPTFMVTSPAAVTDITVLGCGLMAWKPPTDTGNEDPGYAVRFFNGDTYETSNMREIQRYFDDPNARWAQAENLPDSGVLYADIRARNGGGSSAYSQRVVVANSALCPSTVETTSAPCPVVVCPVPRVADCPTAPACDSCCKTCPEVVPCESTEPPTRQISLPSTVPNVRTLNCTTIVWDAPEDDGGEVPEYRLRIFTRETYGSTPSSERMVIATSERWSVPANLPAERPIRVLIKARNSAGFSSLWSDEVILTSESTCPCSS